MGVVRMKVKWRGAAERTLGGALTGTPQAATVGGYETTTLSAAGATWWATKWAVIKTGRGAAGQKLHFHGVSWEGCAVAAAGWLPNNTGSTGCAGAAHRKHVVRALTKTGGAQQLGSGAGDTLYAPTPTSYAALQGPVVRLVAGGSAYITKLTASVVSNLCATAKLQVTAWSATVTLDAVAANVATTADLLWNSNAAGLVNTHRARPWHNLDVPGWTACVLHYRCPAAGAALDPAFTATAATAADCAGTTGVTAKFPRKRATLAAGKQVKVEAFVSGSAWGASGTAAQKALVTATGTVLVKLYANCAEITAVTATPLSKTVTAAAGKTVTTPVTFAHNMAATWTQAGMCGEAVSVSAGANKAWVTWAAGVATVKVPADAPTAKTTVTITAAYPAQGGGGHSGTATGTGSFTLTLDVTAAPKAGGAGGKSGGAADVAGTAASVVAGVLGGALFAAAFAPAPPAATAGAGASAAAGGASGAQDA
jgi:hypothetical protein